jgi:hypothetical protein
MNHNIIDLIISKCHIYTLAKMRYISHDYMNRIETYLSEISIIKYLDSSLESKHNLLLIEDIVSKSDSVLICEDRDMNFWQENQAIILGDINPKFWNPYNAYVIILYMILRFRREKKRYILNVSRQQKYYQIFNNGI